MAMSVRMFSSCSRAMMASARALARSGVSFAAVQMKTADGNEGRTHTGIAGQIVILRFVVQLRAADDVLHLRQPDSLPVIILWCIGPAREIQADLKSHAELGLLAVRRVRRHQLP